MKKILLVAALLLPSLITIAQEMNNALTPRRQGLAVIAALEAKGDQAGLETALAEALDKGLTVSEAKEALSQLYAYTGFPRSLNALGTLKKVLDARLAAGIHDNPGKEADPLPAGYDALKQGTEVQTRLTGKPFNYSFVPATDYYLKAHLFGDIFARDNLSHADREIVTVCAISALPGCEPQLIAHVSGARNMGVSDDELRSLPGLLEAKVGLAEAERLRGALGTVSGDAHRVVETVDFSIWPKGQPNTAYAQYFTGNSYLAQMDGGLANVTFEPGCRNNWHIHHRQVQVLVCVAGRGWYQEWGKPAVPLVPGTVIEIPEGAKHWHGAARDSWMQHLTYHKDVREGASNEWLEPVTGEQYDAVGMKTLVACFSATGTTAAVAKDLAEVTGATLYEIKPAEKYTAADLDWRDKQSRSSLEMRDRSSRPAIVKDLDDAGSYDVIYIGFPVWWYTAPTLINTFIEAYGFQGKTVIFFATSGGSSIDKANAEFKKQYPDINWKAGKTLNAASREDIKAWVDSL